MNQTHEYRPDIADEHAKAGRGLGRIFIPDGRDYQHLMARPAALPTIQAKTWRAGAVWDQGQTSMCVAYSGVKYLAASPIINDLPEGDSFETVYNWCRDNDEWPGADYDGTSVRAFMKWGADRQFISGYEWAFDNLPIINHLATVGPVVAGTDWTESMFNPVKGFIRVAPDGQYTVAGGHAWPLIGFDRRKKCPDGTRGAYLMQNSWGPSWGVKGRAWVSFADFSILLRNQGEAAVAVELQKPRKKRKRAA